VVRQKIAVAFPRNAEGAEDILTLVALAKIVLAVEYAKLDYGVIRAIIQALMLRMKWQLSAEEVAFLTLNWRQNSMQNLKWQLQEKNQLIIATDIAIRIGKDTKKTTTGVKRRAENSLSPKEIMQIILGAAIAGAVKKGRLMIFAYIEMVVTENTQIMNHVTQQGMVEKHVMNASTDGICPAGIKSAAKRKI